jgi:tRNA(Ile)-lysidine synthase
MLETFIQHIASRRLILANERVLVAVSGGVDSIVLAHLFAQAPIPFSIAHCNFQLRGHESDMDEQFVTDLAAKYSADIHCRAFDTSDYAAQRGISIQLAARELRYAWFTELVDSGTVDVVATAHHADDNIETAMMNFFRGTGISGLRGMRERSGYIIRPLLSFRKSELLAYANANDLRWREDSSNAGVKYTRNFFRNKLIPAVSEAYPEAETNVLRNIERFRDVESIYRQAMDRIIRKTLIHSGPELFIPINKIITVPERATILFEIISKYGFTSGQLHDALSLMHAGEGRYIESSTYRIIKDRHRLLIAPKAKSDDNFFMIDEETTGVAFPSGQLSVRLVSGTNEIEKDNNVAMIDRSQLKYPLILRRKRAGDYFYPLGMKKKKKISRFLIDKKLSAPQKENVWVLESDRRIVWVVGHRIDDRFKVTEKSREVLMIRLEKR